ncbi:MAG: sterol-4-alpha-carboxylate 3-dehydrogenase, partial [Bacteroidetes bacterium]
MNNGILITGAAGFLGGRTAKFFAQNYPSRKILATSRRDSRRLELEAQHCEFKAGDLLDISFCEEICKNIEIIIHCAALSAPFGSYNSFYKSNFIATDNLIKAAKKFKVQKFIFISTPSIYFNYRDRFNVSEADELPTKLVNHYAKTKLLAENLVLNAQNSELQTISLRPRAIIGAEDTVIFPRVLEAHKQGKL